MMLQGRSVHSMNQLALRASYKAWAVILLYVHVKSAVAKRCQCHSSIQRSRVVVRASSLVKVP